MHQIKELIDIKDIIYEVRGKKVMLDSDLAKLYETSTKRINEVVKRNLSRFPEEFCFKVNDSESIIIWSQIASKKIKIENRGGRYKNPYVFTEHGIMMLAGLLKSDIAAKVNVNIIKAFVEMRKFINENKDIFKRMLIYENKTEYIENSLLEQKIRIDELFDKFDRKEDMKSKLFFNGEIYDAYSLLIDIIGKASNEIIIIDNYVDKVTLDILSKKNINVTVLLIMDKNKSKLTKTDIDKFNSEYPSLEKKYTNIFHDRFIILDKKHLYHLGASLKDLGKKVFGITKIEDKNILDGLLNKLNNMKS